MGRLGPGLTAWLAELTKVHGETGACGHYELGVDALPGMTLAAVFDELGAGDLSSGSPRSWMARVRRSNNATAP